MAERIEWGHECLGKGDFLSPPVANRQVSYTTLELHDIIHVIADWTCAEIIV